MNTTEGLSLEAARVLASIEPEVVRGDLTLDDERRAWDEAMAGQPLAPDVVERVEQVEGVHCRRFLPKDGKHDRPILVWAHGGGLVTGSSVTHRVFGALLAAEADVEVLVPDYRLLPEHGIDDAMTDLAAVLGAVAETATADGVKRRGVAVGGDSSGAALAIGAVGDGSGPARQVDGLVSLCGAFDATLSSASIDDADDPQLSREVLVHWRDTVATVCEPADPRLSPLFADLRSVPPVLALAAGRDVWRDDSVRLAQRLRTAGVTVQLEVWDRMWHSWPLWGDFPESRAALRRIGAFLRRD